jgi:hypothetical protein
LAVGDLSGVQQDAVHLLHGIRVVGPGAVSGLGVLPVAPVHLGFPQLPCFATVLTFVHEQVEVRQVD